VALTIPLALLIAFIFMHHFKIPANLLSLGAIDFGILVDGSVVVLENILRRREREQERPLTRGCHRGHAAGGAPHLLRHGRDHRRLPAAVRLPAHRVQAVLADGVCGRRGAGGRAGGGAAADRRAWPGWPSASRASPQPRAGQAGRRYGRFLERMVGRQRWVAMVCAGAGGAGLLAAPSAATSCPTWTKARSGCRCRCRPGSRWTRRRHGRRAAPRTLEFPEVSTIVTQTGRNDDGTDYWTPSHIEASVGLHPYKSWKSGMSKQQLIAKMNERFARMPATPWASCSR
jgi:cobalt-zinc-cadmium resistance protein CzcA